MLRKILMWILLAAPPLLLLRWDTPSHPVPKWLLLLAAAPLAIASLISDDGEESGRLGNFLLFLMGLFGMGMGIVGFALRDAPAMYGLGGFFAWMFPLGLIMMVAAVFRGLRG